MCSASKRSPSAGQRRRVVGQSVDVDRDLEALAVVADVDLVADRLLLARQPLLGQPLPGLVGELAEHLAELAALELGEPAQHRAGRLVAPAGGGVAEGAEHAG